MAENKKITSSDIKDNGFEKYYTTCSFEGIDFTNQTITNVKFENCKFNNCNFSMTKLYCSLSDVEFEECKIVGTDFSNINKFSMDIRFINNMLSYASFVDINLRDARFINCKIYECDFTGTNLSCSLFDECDLNRTVFTDTNLEKVNFETSYNFDINPNTNKINKMIVSESELRGLVSYLNIIIK